MAAGSNQAAFVSAIQAGDELRVQSLLDGGGVTLNPSGVNRKVVPIFAAAIAGHDNIVRFLIARGAAVNTNGNEGWTPLMSAAFHDRVTVMRTLISAGANIDAQNSNGFSPLHETATQGYMEATQLLLDHGANRALKTKTRQTAEQQAMKHGHNAVARLIRGYVPRAVAGAPPRAVAPALPPPPPYDALPNTAEEVLRLNEALVNVNAELANALARIDELTKQKAPQIPEIPISHLEFDGSTLGHGAFGAVLAASWLGTPVAVKHLFALRGSANAYGRLSPLANERVRNELRREFETLAALRSPYLVTFFGVVCNDEGPDQIVFERLDAIPPEHNVIHLCHDVAHGLAYLHHSGYIHHDIKPRNTLYDKSRNTFKITDLGLAQALRGRSSATATMRGTLSYLAPEVQEGFGPTVAVDVFAFAVMVLEVFTGCDPSPTNNKVEGVVIEEIVRRHEDLTRMPEGATKALIIQSIATNPEARPKASAWAEHFRAMKAVDRTAPPPAF